MANRLKIIFLFAFMALGILAPSALATGSECTSGNCQFIPAQFHEEAVSIERSGSHGSSVENVSIKKIQKEIKKFEKKKHVKVAIYQNPNGYEGDDGCIDPTNVPRWDFHVGEAFVNSDHYKNHFRDTWKKSYSGVCEWKVVKKNGHWWVHGTKENCANVDIWIPIRFHLKKPSKKVIEVVSYAVFYKKFVLNKTVTKESTATSEHVTSRGSWTCPTGWEAAGTQCKKCPPPECKPCPPGNTPNEQGKCVKDGNSTPPPPPTAPGPNPPPSGGTGDPGSNKCYSEDTGQPVPEQPGGGCPPGSHG